MMIKMELPIAPFTKQVGEEKMNSLGITYGVIIFSIILLLLVSKKIFELVDETDQVIRDFKKVSRKENNILEALNI